MTETAVTAGRFMWLEEETPGPTVDRHLALRAEFVLDRDSDVELCAISSGWFQTSIDGAFVCDGPVRYDAGHPEYSQGRIRLTQGTHAVAVHAHHPGVETQLLLPMDPFIACWVLVDGEERELDWRLRRLDAYTGEVRRINPNLGWVEWCDTRLLPAGWTGPGFDDGDWPAPAIVAPGLGPLRPASLGPIVHTTIAATAAAQGLLAEVLLAAEDDPPAAFTLRERAPRPDDATGAWFRYDLGRTRLGRPVVEFDVAAATVVQLGYAERLIEGRIAPYIDMSNGLSANLDHYVARGGRQAFGPMSPRGLRFLEVHVLGTSQPIPEPAVSFVDRGYFGAADGEFACGDPVLDKVWQTSVDTLRACTEDAIIDCPTRERGQWLGDASSVGMEVMAVAFRDLRLVKRALRQAAWCADEDGFVAGMFPGRRYFLASYAAQWVSGCVRYTELTGDAELLHELYPVAQRNIAAFQIGVGPGGLREELPWPFIDWGYQSPEPGRDLALDLHLLAAVRDLTRWAAVVGDSEGEHTCHDLERTLLSAIVPRLPGHPDGADWARVGFHGAALALRRGLLAGAVEASAVAFLKDHLLSCFPNDLTAPRLGRVDATNPRLITPYFANFSLPALIERGEMDFVLDQYRRCWGWVLDQGLTTWPETFDLRWSNCHQWSGAPGWQLSRYLLGLHPRLAPPDPPTFDVRVAPGSMASATGTLPIPDRDGTLRVRWQRIDAGLDWSIETDRPVTLYLPGNAEPVHVDRSWRGTVVPAW